MQFFKDLLFTPPWTHDYTEQAFILSSYIELTYAIICLAVAVVIYINVRKAPSFIRSIIIGIIVVNISIIVVAGGLALNIFNGIAGHAIKLYFICLYQSLDIVLYWLFAISYWETAFNISAFIKRSVAFNDSGY